jgi:Type IV secretory pathway, VirB11 components, and related ATPases involved in archaeal flagella biosynthesis
MTIYSVTMTAIVAIAIIGIIYYFLRPDPLADLDADAPLDPFCLDVLINGVKDQFGEFEKLNIAELNLNRLQSAKVENNKRRFSRAKKTCCYGDSGAKDYIKMNIKKILTEILGLNEGNITHAIPFDDSEDLSVREKFDILLYIYKKQFGNQAMKQFILVNHFEEPVGEGAEAVYKITAEQIALCYKRHEALISKLDYEDRLEIVAQRVYASYIGLGIFDELLDMDIDGVRGGTSGINESLLKVVGEMFSRDHGDLPIASYNATWIIFRGTEMHLSFLGCGTQEEFVRIASRIYKYEDPGTLDASRGGIIGKMMNGSRVVVTRPPAAESWAFFVRKLDAGSRMPIEVLMPDKGNDKLISLVKFLIMGEENIALTGEQRTGKTTFMMSIIQFIKSSYTIRIVEKESELNLRNVYPERDILSFKDIETFKGQEELNIIKKTDGSVNLIGEVADYEQAAWAIQTGETGSNQVMFTGHMKTPELLIDYFRTAMLSTTPGSTSKIEEALCARVLNINIHLSKTISGHRFVERVTMIVPRVLEEYPKDLQDAQREYFIRQTDRPTFEAVDLLRWVDGEYIFVGEFTPEVAERIAFKLSEKERYEFKLLCERMGEEVRDREVA